METGSFFTSEVAKAEILKKYDLIKNSLEMVVSVENLKTSFGETNVLIAGDVNKPPLVLLHGLNACAPMALERFSFLTDRYCVYAVDLLGEPNRSEQVRLDKKNDDYGLWLYEVIDKLGLIDVTLVGGSFGGFVALKLLLVDYLNVKAVCLVSSAGIVNGNIFKFLFKFYLPFLSFQKSHKEHKFDKCYKALFTDDNEQVIDYLKSVFLKFKADKTVTPLFKQGEFNSVKTPIYVVSAENDLLFPGQNLNKRALQLFPSFEKSLLLEKSQHVFGEKDKREVETFF